MIRRPTTDDAEQLKQAVDSSLQALRRYMPWALDEPTSIEQRRTLLAEWSTQWDEAKDFPYVIFIGAECVGSTGLHTRQGVGSLEIGYWVKTSHVGRGIATVVSHALTNAAFEVDGVSRVIIRHHVSNVASRRIPEKLGYTLIGTKQRDCYADGVEGDSLWWERYVPID